MRRGLRKVLFLNEKALVCPLLQRDRVGFEGLILPQLSAGGPRETVETKKLLEE
jgi:hypothetical protein